VPENQLLNESESHPGGLAPADRQCHYTKSDGQRCRDWTLRGQNHCFRHDRYIHHLPERPVDVPLLEDEDSIVYLLSQTLQALAWGTIPVTNGRALLAGCRLAHSMHAQRLEAAKFRFKLRRLGIPEHEIFDPITEPGSSEPVLSKCQPEGGTRRTDLCPEPGTQSSEPTPNPVKVRPKDIQFRDLRKNWDKELLKAGNEMSDMIFKRYGEAKEDFLASRATPFEHLAEVDREVERARAMAKAAQSETCSPTC
jgi:hypothetical protein